MKDPMVKTLARLIALFALAAVSARAADKTWANAGTDYNDGASWVGGVAPGAGDAVVFQSAVVTNQPTLSASITNQQIRFATCPTGTGWVVSSADAANQITLTSAGSGTSAGSAGAAVIVNTFDGGNPVISAPIVLGAAAGSTQRVNVPNTGSKLTFSGPITEETGPVTFALESPRGYVVNLSGTNTFSGGLYWVDGPVLELGNTGAVPTAGTVTIGRVSGQGGGGMLRSSDNTPHRIANPFVMYADPASSNRVAFGTETVGQQGSIVFSGNGTLASNTGIRVKSNGQNEPCVVAFEGVIDDLGAGRDLTVLGGSGENVASQVWRGYAFLMASNTYSGKSVLFAKWGAERGSRAGACVVNSVANAGQPCSLGAGTGGNAAIPIVQVENIDGNYFAQGTLRYIGSVHSTDRPLQYGPTAGSIGSGGSSTLWLDASGSGALTWNADMTINTASVTRAVVLTGTSTNENTFAGVIPAPAVNSSSLAKDGRGTWVLKGANTFNGHLTNNSGRLVLDYTSNTTVVTTNTMVTLGGATLELRGKSGSGNSTAQTCGNLTTTAHTGLNTVRINQNGGAGTTLASAALTRGANSALLFDLEGTTAGSSVTATSLLSSINGGILIKDSAGRVDFATNSAANTALTALNSTTDLPAAPAAAGNYRLTASQTLAGGNQSARSLRIEPAGPGQTLSIANDFAIGGGGVLFAGTNDFAVGGSGRLWGGQYNSIVMAHFGAGKLTLNVDLSYIGADGSTHSSFQGSGLFDLGKRYANSAGTCAIGGATVRNGSSGGLLLSINATGAGSCGLVLTGGGVMELTDQDFTRNIGTGAGAVQWKGDGGFSACGAPRAVRLCTNGAWCASIAWGNHWSPGSFVPPNNALVLGSPYSDNTIDFQNGLFFGCQQRVVHVQDGVSSTNVDAVLSGGLTGRYGGGLIKEGAGTLEITGNSNTYEGDTWVREGTLRVDNASGEGTGCGRVIVFGGAAIGGTGTVNRLTLQSGGRLVVFNTGVGRASKLKVTGALDIANGTLDLTGLTSLAAGDQVIAECGSLVGTQFVSVRGLTPGCVVYYNATSIGLREIAGVLLQFK